MSWLQPRPDGVTLQVRLTPRAARAAVLGLVGDRPGGERLRISVTAAPTDGKANAALITLLAKTYRIPKTSIMLAGGETSRLKTLHISGDPAELEGKIRERLVS